METFRSVLLVTHIICGCAALIAGFAAILSRKGCRLHRKSGKLFFFSMLGTTLSALILAAVTKNKFLLLIGIFSFFQNYFGFRVVQKKNALPQWFDWLILFIAAINTVLLLISFNIVLVTFGIISLSQVYSQALMYYRIILRKEILPDQWLIQHISMALGAYIATLTAFLVINARGIEPFWLVWITPSIIGSFIISHHIRKQKKAAHLFRHQKKAILLLIMFWVGAGDQAIRAQPYVDGGKTRHRFAQLNLGIEARHFFAGQSGSQQFTETGIQEPFNLGNQADARIIVGGTHFWGHADFYVSIPVMDFSKSGFAANVETGGRYYPWRIEHHKLRPYAGAAFLPVIYRQGNGTSQMRCRYPLTAGITFTHKHHLFELGTGYFWNNRSDYYIDPITPVEVRSQSFWLSFSYKFMLETTLSAERDWISGRTKRLTDTLATLKKLNGITVAAGPSSAFFLRKSSYNQTTLPFLDNHKAASVFGDFGIGYYFHQPDLQINLAWRSIKSELTAYNHRQLAHRRSLTLEAFKFISDYHGFAAFLGPAVSVEWLELKETSASGVSARTHDQLIRPGITFGWDIRPNRLQSIILRTNLRYFPQLNLTTSDGNQFSFDQLEFNFIQVVLFPGRMF